jgi:hypothetical protein
MNNRTHTLPSYLTSIATAMLVILSVFTVLYALRLVLQPMPKLLSYSLPSQRYLLPESMASWWGNTVANQNIGQDQLNRLKLIGVVASGDKETASAIVSWDNQAGKLIKVGQTIGGQLILRDVNATGIKISGQQNTPDSDMLWVPLQTNQANNTQLGNNNLATTNTAIPLAQRTLPTPPNSPNNNANNPTPPQSSTIMNEAIPAMQPRF